MFKKIKEKILEAPSLYIGMLLIWTSIIIIIGYLICFQLFFPCKVTLNDGTGFVDCNCYRNQHIIYVGNIMIPESRIKEIEILKDCEE